MCRKSENAADAFGEGAITRRRLMSDVVTALASAAAASYVSASGAFAGSNIDSRLMSNTALAQTEENSSVAYGKSTLPSGIRSRFVKDVNGLTIHILEAGFEGEDRSCVLLLHGFPELAYSWRKVMLPLARAGYHVVAPDQRGYGRTTGWDGDYDGDIGPFRMFNLVRDALGLVSALGYKCVAAVVGHDFGSPVAAWCALIRPDVFRSVVLMSARLRSRPLLPPPDAPPDSV